MKKNVNLILLLVIASTLLLFSGFSAYYSLKLKNTAIETQQSRQQLEAVTGRLVVIESIANESLESRETLEKDKETLEEGFLQLQSENEAYRKELASAKAELASANAELSGLNSRFSLLQGRFYEVESGLIRQTSLLLNFLIERKSCAGSWRVLAEVMMGAELPYSD